MNSKIGCGSVTIVQGVDHLICIGDTDIIEGHRYHTTECTINIKMYLQMPIDHLDLDIEP